MTEKEIEKIAGDLVGYIHPEYFQNEFKNKVVPGKNFNKETAEKYYVILMTISWFLRKISKYEIYFAEFFPSTQNISDYEALEHHIHAYLEDVETLRNKLMYFVGTLKNDLKKIASNKKEIVEAMEWLNGQISKTFTSVSTIRGRHRHDATTFVDSNIINGQMAEYMLSEKNIFKDQLTPYALDLFAKQKVEYLEKGKIFWINNVKNNIPQVEGITNEVLQKTKTFLYNFLDIEPLDFLYKSNNNN